MKFRFLHPEVFQGNTRKKNYFEGWYFKHVSSNLEHVWSFIPGISLNSNDNHAFIQIINGISGETHYIAYDLNKFTWAPDKLELKIGDSLFTSEYIDLNIASEKINLLGRLNYSDHVTYPSGLSSPGIMGWYSYVPFMECKHGIVSANHEISGSIISDGSSVSFDGGKGYIEKDWGSSFPEVWIWIQSNNFTNRSASFSFSVAKIPWLGKYFMGFIAFLYCDGKFNIFATYNRSVLNNVSHDKNTVSLTLTNAELTLDVSVTRNRAGELRAPVSGSMSRRIKESVDATVSLTMSDKKGRIVFSDEGKRAGLEIIEDIFRYL
jgi:tocopherol cyclase